MGSVQGGDAPAPLENWKIWSGLTGIGEDLFLKPVLLCRETQLDVPFHKLDA